MPSRVHEWAWGDARRRTVCGLVRRLDGAEVVSDLGGIEVERRCKNCDRMRATCGTSSRPVSDPLAVTPAAIAAASAAGELTPREREIIEHTTGWRSRWPLFRNHFCAGPGHEDLPTILGLVSRGLMNVTREPSAVSGGDTVYGATAAGIAALKEGQPSRAASGESNTTG